MESGLRNTGLSAMAVGTGGAFIGLSSGVFTLTEALLLVTAISVTGNAVFNMVEG